MFCSNCGCELKKGAKFCSKCGAQILSPGENQEERPVQTESGAPCADYDTAETSDAEPAVSDQVIASEQPKKKKKILAAVIIIILAVAVAAVVFFVWNGGGSEKQFQSHMEAGQTYLEEQAYDEAVDEFEAAIEIQSEAVEPYRLMAQAYIGMDDSESVEATYDTIRGIIVTHYETSEENELLEDSQALYIDAIDYYGEQEDADTVEELVEEIVPMLTEESDVEEIEELGEQWISQIEEEEAESGTEASSDIPSKDQVQNLLDLLNPYFMKDKIAYYNEGSLEEWNYGEITVNEAVELAAISVYTYELYAEIKDYYYFINGEVYAYEELTESLRQSESYNNGSSPYCIIPSELLIQYIRNMFGAGFELSDFTESDDMYPVKYYDGQIYYPIGEISDWSTTVGSVENVMASPDQDGTYTALMKYTISFEDDEHDEYYRYMNYQIREDSDSEYGYVITGMTPE